MEFQTQDTPAQSMDLYYIEGDGSLWHEDYDTVDRNDPTLPRKHHQYGYVTDFTGEIRFYAVLPDGERVEFFSYFNEGTLRDLRRIS